MTGPPRQQRTTGRADICAGGRGPQPELNPPRSAEGSAEDHQHQRTALLILQLQPAEGRRAAPGGPGSPQCSPGTGRCSPTRLAGCAPPTPAAGSGRCGRVRALVAKGRPRGLRPPGSPGPQHRLLYLAVTPRGAAHREGAQDLVAGPRHLRGVRSARLPGPCPLRKTQPHVNRSQGEAPAVWTDC